MKRIIILFIMLFYADLLIAQQAGPNIRLPQVVPATPDAIALSKYINYPVDYSNGLVKIDIPIYEIKEGDIKIPISLSYHASGFRLNQPDSWLGMCWTLNAEPAISRSVQGLPDEKSYLLDASHAPSLRNSYYYMKYLADGNYDEEPDEFYFRFLDQRGKFYIKKEYGKSPEIITIPYVPLKINHNPELSVFTARDTKGLSYHFGGNQFANVEFTGLGKATCWKATSVNSMLTGRTVSFSYHPREYKDLGLQHTDMVTILDSLPPNSMAPVFEFDPMSPQSPPPEFQLPLPVVKEQRFLDSKYFKVVSNSSSQGQLVSLPLLSSSSSGAVESKISHLNIHEINFTEGKLVFEKQYGLLRSINLFNKNNELLKSFVFYHSRESSTIPYQLDSIVCKDSELNPVERYKFSYNHLPLNAYSRSIDYWGYYNAANNNNVSLIPPIAVSAPGTYGKVNFTIGGGDRMPNESAMQMGILKSITYPSGGRTNFEYEPHKYRNAQGAIKLAGGLRIRSITDIDEKGQTIIKNIRYGQNEDGTGFLPYPLSDEDFYSESMDLYCHPNFIAVDPINMGYKWYSSSSIIPVRRRTYSCNSFTDMFYESGSAVKYREVAEYTAKDYYNYEKTGKKTYLFDIPPTLPRSPKITGQSIVYDYKLSWLKGQDTLSTDYKLSEGNYLPVREQEKTYHDEFLPGKSFLVGKTYRRNNVISDSNPSWLNYESFAYISYNVTSGYKNLIKSKEKLYNGVTPVIEEHNYKYDNFLNLREDSTTKSDNKPLKYKYTYPYNNGMLRYIINDNISPIITKETYTNNVLTERTKYDYSYSAPHGMSESPFLQSLNYGIGTNPMEKRVVYHNYDAKGNPLSVGLEGGVKKNYIWAYNGQYPIAEIINADYAAIETILGATNISSFNNTNANKADVDNFIAPLKAALPDAQITTFTYKPLVGLTSQTDAKGLTTYYEYDSFQRLKHIKDQNWNILKSYDYHYKP